MATETHKHQEDEVGDLSQNSTQGEEEELQMAQGQKINNQMSACFLGVLNRSCNLWDMPRD